MPRYFLHVCNGDGFTEDEEGQAFPSLDAARAAAIAGLRDIMSNELKSGHLNMASFIEIEDEDHELVMTVPFADAVAVTSQYGKRR